MLVIDEAQNLADGLLEQVRLLSNLETNTEKLIQIVLTGQPELRDILASPVMAPLRQRIALEHHVQPLREHEVESYLRAPRARGGQQLSRRVPAGCEPRVLRDLRRLPAPDQPARRPRAARGLLGAGAPDQPHPARAQGQGDRRPRRRAARASSAIAATASTAATSAPAARLTRSRTANATGSPGSSPRFATNQIRLTQ